MSYFFLHKPKETFHIAAELSSNLYLEEDYSQWPYIALRGIFFCHKNLRCHVYRRSDDAGHQLFLGEYVFSKTEIGYFQLIFANEDIFGFEIAVNNTLFNELSKAHTDLLDASNSMVFLEHFSLFNDLNEATGTF